MARTDTSAVDRLTAQLRASEEALGGTCDVVGTEDTTAIAPTST